MLLLAPRDATIKQREALFRHGRRQFSGEVGAENDASINSASQPDVRETSGADARLVRRHGRPAVHLGGYAALEKRMDLPHADAGAWPRHRHFDRPARSG